MKIGRFKIDLKRIKIQVIQIFLHLELLLHRHILFQNPEKVKTGLIYFLHHQEQECLPE